MAKRRFEAGDLIVDHKGNVGIVLGPTDSRTVTVYIGERRTRTLHDSRVRLLSKRNGGRMFAGAKV